MDKSTVKEDVRAIKEALLGSEMRPEGALARLNSMENRLVHLEKLVERARYIILALVLSTFDDLYEGLTRLINLF